MSIGRNDNDNKFKSSIDPKPISSCDIVKAMLRAETRIQQTPPYPAIRLQPIEGPPGTAQNCQFCWGDDPKPVYSSTKLFDRAKNACEFDKVVNPLEMLKRKQNNFTSRDEYQKLYCEAVDKEKLILEYDITEVLPPRIG